MPETQEKEALYSLAFGVHNHGGDLYSAKVIKIKDGKVAEWKHGVETSLGHALCIAEDLMSAYVVQAHDVSVSKFYDEIRVI